MCRREAAHHRQVATATPLDKVRERALKAATAWEAEAAKAEAREAGARDALSPEDSAIALEFRLEEEEGAWDNVLTPGRGEAKLLMNDEVEQFGSWVIEQHVRPDSV